MNHPHTTLLLLLLSHFSRVRLHATPQTAAHQAPPSLGFSRQEHWSGSPFPSPMHACMLSCFSRVRLCVTPWTAVHQAPLSTGFSISFSNSRSRCLRSNNTSSGQSFPTSEMKVGQALFIFHQNTHDNL